MIGDHIEVKVIAVDGDQVKLGIVAPKSVKVYRSEIFESIQQQNKEALEISANLFKKLKLKN